MNKETLKTLRIIIPGILIILVSLLLLQKDFDITKLFESLKLFEGILYFIVVVGLGALYYIFNIRTYFIKDSLREIQDNIKEQLLSSFSSDKIIADHREQLHEGRTLIHVFYNIIDNDESLREKAKNVYLNGLIWSSVADIMALSLIAIPFYAGVYIYWHQFHHLIFAFIFFALYLISSFLLLPNITKKHIDLSNEQIEYIELYFRENLHKKLIELAGKIS